jgi:hypothetical protein
MAAKNPKPTPLAQIIIDAGQILHGDDWRGRLAKQLGINRQVVYGIAAGKKPVSDNTWRAFEALLKKEPKRLRKDAERIEDLLAKATDEIKPKRRLEREQE